MIIKYVCRQKERDGYSYEKQKHTVCKHWRGFAAVRRAGSRKHHDGFEQFGSVHDAFGVVLLA